MVDYTKPERVNLKGNTKYNERWIQDKIAADPSILGLGNLVVRDKERIQPRAGRLDLLLQDLETKRRYEVEIQLGSTDESHIIRTIEYWDIERKRYPQYEHCAVIVAEDITSRFLNIISLFNGTVPLVAIQMQAFNVGEHFTVLFTTVVDELSRGLVDADEEAEASAVPTDRSYWDGLGSKSTMAMVDQMLAMLKELDPTIELRFNKFYVGLAREGSVDNFVRFRPRKNHVSIAIKLPQASEIDEKINGAGLDSAEYNTREKRYYVNVGKSDIAKHGAIIKELLGEAFRLRTL